MVATKVVIVGAGAAGIFTAYRLREMYGDAYAVTILEAKDRVGGNCETEKVTIEGQDYAIDCAAQFFYRRAQVSYVELLEKLGLTEDEHRIVEAPSGFGIWDRAANAHRLRFPTNSWWLLTHPGQWDELIHFVAFLIRCVRLDRSATGGWDMSVDEWLASDGKISEFEQRVVKPFLYPFLSLPLDRIGQGSARYAATYMARKAFGEPDVELPGVDPADLPGKLGLFKTYQSLIGLAGILQIVLDKSGATLVKECTVTKITPDADGQLVVKTSTGDTFTADHVVLATDPHTSAKILAATPPANDEEAQLVSLLREIEYADLDVLIQKDASPYMPPEEKDWEPVNTIVDGQNVMFTAWFGPLREPEGDGDRIKVFKSWGASLDPPPGPSPLFKKRYSVLYPTTVSITARDEVMSEHHGARNIWFAGGWTNWFDSQEAALDSATRVARDIDGHAPAMDHDPDAPQACARRLVQSLKDAAPVAHNDAFDAQLRQLDD